MLRAWLVDANFIFVLVSISSYVSFSLAYIRLFHPMNVFFFTSLGAYLFSSCSSVTIRPIYFFFVLVPGIWAHNAVNTRSRGHMPST